MSNEFTPNLRTAIEDHCKEEQNKCQAKGYIGQLKEDFIDASRPDIAWESEQIAKSHGIYLEFNRAKTGKDKDWIYMIRVSIPGGGPISPQQWELHSTLASQYGITPEGEPTLRFTTRQTIQYHWIKKENVPKIVKALAEAGMNSLNGCGDNTRNTVACPLSRFSDIIDGNTWAKKISSYFQLPLEPFIQIFGIDPTYLRQPEEHFAYGPQLLNRKFKIAISALHRNHAGLIVPDNCVELRSNDVGIAPMVDNSGAVDRFQIYIGGGQGERNGKLTGALLGQALGIVDAPRLIAALDAIVTIHQDWGDRQNRHWARLKYVVKKMGIDWFRDRVHEIVDFKMDTPQPDYDYGSRELHHGWIRQPSNGQWTFGAFIENGRVINNSPNGQIKTMIDDLVKKYRTQITITPNQDLLFNNIPEEAKENFQADMTQHGYGQRHGKSYSALRLQSGACVGRDTCRLTYTDSEKFEPELIDELERLGWGGVSESIGITGCERQCFRPSTKAIGLVGTGLNRYQVRVMGATDGRHQGVPIHDTEGQVYLRTVPREKVAHVISALFENHHTHKRDHEPLGYFHHRIGMQKIIDYLKSHPQTSELMQKTATQMFLQ